ncbi:hypothetical protein KIPB_014129, partial [Kipferlia bialata]|eukprot:g14129.t1
MAKPSTRIIATMASVDTIPSLEGATHIRLNASHMSVPRIEACLKELGTDRDVYIDLQGSKMRLNFDQPEFDALSGQTIPFRPEYSADHPHTLLVCQDVLNVFE